MNIINKSLPITFFFIISTVLISTAQITNPFSELMRNIYWSKEVGRAIHNQQSIIDINKLDLAVNQLNFADEVAGSSHTLRNIAYPIVRGFCQIPFLMRTFQSAANFIWTPKTISSYSSWISTNPTASTTLSKIAGNEQAISTASNIIKSMQTYKESLNSLNRDYGPGYLYNSKAYSILHDTAEHGVRSDSSSFDRWLASGFWNSINEARDNLQSNLSQAHGRWLSQCEINKIHGNIMGNQELIRSLGNRLGYTSFTSWINPLAWSDWAFRTFKHLVYYPARYPVLHGRMFFNKSPLTCAITAVVVYSLGHAIYNVFRNRQQHNVAAAAPAPAPAVVLAPAAPAVVLAAPAPAPAAAPAQSTAQSLGSHIRNFAQQAIQALAICGALYYLSIFR